MLQLIPRLMWEKMLILNQSWKEKKMQENLNKVSLWPFITFIASYRDMYYLTDVKTRTKIILAYVIKKHSFVNHSSVYEGLFALKKSQSAWPTLSPDRCMDFIYSWTLPKAFKNHANIYLSTWRGERTIVPSISYTAELSQGLQNWALKTYASSMDLNLSS